MVQRISLAVVMLLLLVGIGRIVWAACDLPPLKLVARHGLPPAGGPTGRKVTIEEVTFVELAPGYFRMGSGKGGGNWVGRVCAVLRLPWGKQPEGVGDDMPVHWVEFARGFWIAETEVTNSQYERFDPKHGRCWYSEGDHDPVTYVNWMEARQYCQWLTTRGELMARLPSESEWENACRAGSRTEFCFGEDEQRLGEVAWYNGNSGGKAHAVATRRANAWGLHDLHGNVWEWVEDAYHTDYTGAPNDGRAWTEGGEMWEGSPYRVFRGGSWSHLAESCRSALRSSFGPGDRYGFLGFRPAASRSR